MVIVFIKNKHILPENITNTINEYFFVYLLIANEEKNIMKKVVLSIYKDNMQIRKKRDFFAYYKFDLPLL